MSWQRKAPARQNVAKARVHGTWPSLDVENAPTLRPLGTHQTGPRGALRLRGPSLSQRDLRLTVTVGADGSPGLSDRRPDFSEEGHLECYGLPTGSYYGFLSDETGDTARFKLCIEDGALANVDVPSFERRETRRLLLQAEGVPFTLPATVVLRYDDFEFVLPWVGEAIEVPGPLSDPRSAVVRIEGRMGGPAELPSVGDLIIDVAPGPLCLALQSTTDISDSPATFRIAPATILSRAPEYVLACMRDGEFAVPPRVHTAARGRVSGASLTIAGVKPGAHRVGVGLIGLAEYVLWRRMSISEGCSVYCAQPDRAAVVIPEGWRARRPDYVQVAASTGDTIGADRPFSPFGPAQLWDEYRTQAVHARRFLGWICEGRATECATHALHAIDAGVLSGDVRERRIRITAFGGTNDLLYDAQVTGDAMNADLPPSVAGKIDQMLTLADGTVLSQRGWFVDGRVVASAPPGSLGVRQRVQLGDEAGQPVAGALLRTEEGELFGPTDELGWLDLRTGRSAQEVSALTLLAPNVGLGRTVLAPGGENVHLTVSGGDVGWDWERLVGYLGVDPRACRLGQVYLVRCPDGHNRPFLPEDGAVVLAATDQVEVRAQGSDAALWAFLKGDAETSFGTDGNAELFLLSKSMPMDIELSLPRAVVRVSVRAGDTWRIPVAAPVTMQLDAVVRGPKESAREAVVVTLLPGDTLVMTHE